MCEELDDNEATITDHHHVAAALGVIKQTHNESTFDRWPITEPEAPTGLHYARLPRLRVNAERAQRARAARALTLSAGVPGRAIDRSENVRAKRAPHFSPVLTLAIF